MSIRKPVIRKPKVPKIKKPLISKRKGVVKKKPTLSMGRITAKTQKPSNLGKKSTTRTLGTCYREENCKGVLYRKITKTQCRREGGKSWRKIGGPCEKL
ncbi:MULTISPECIES: hypothetical protein [Nitrosopumilus]|uniref:Uncharacterized protein n=1 Tax=Nitrosopumilus piranensis TaxID=1582439 RepID=A0A0C5BZ79_9ARCH|nr:MULTISPECIES: hypothetical protein [Nitrosopumilus]AJM92305.1 hypothetical protein NPIRD3C_1093 [Nitrosopumilus piranensis]KAF6244246.1 hypothetical protein C6989_08085 [Nitrosopumilus sp. b2]